MAYFSVFHNYIKQKKNAIGLPILALIWISFFWGTTWIASKEGVKHMPPMQLVALRQLMRNINNKLRKNYRVLCELNPEDKGKTTKTKLLSKGFDFEFFTSMLQTKTGNTYFFLYDQGYRALEDDFYMLVKKDS